MRAPGLVEFGMVIGLGMLPLAGCGTAPPAELVPAGQTQSDQSWPWLAGYSQQDHFLEIVGKEFILVRLGEAG